MIAEFFPQLKQYRLCNNITYRKLLYIFEFLLG